MELATLVSFLPLAAGSLRCRALGPLLLKTTIHSALRGKRHVNQGKRALSSARRESVIPVKRSDLTNHQHEEKTPKQNRWHKTQGLRKDCFVAVHCFGGPSHLRTGVPL